MKRATLLGLCLLGGNGLPEPAADRPSRNPEAECSDWREGSRLSTLGVGFKYRRCDGDEDQYRVELRIQNYADEGTVAFRFRAFVRAQTICDDRATDSLSGSLLGSVALAPKQWSDTFSGRVTRSQWTAYVYLCAYDVKETP